MKASERLAQALHEVDEFEMEQRAREGYYSDFTSPLATPIRQLVHDLMPRGHDALVKRAMAGEFDGE